MLFYQKSLTAISDTSAPGTSVSGTSASGSISYAGRAAKTSTGFAATMAVAFLVTVLVAGISPAQAKRPRLPEIRMTATNQVPVCVTPERLTKYMHSRNKSKKLRRLYKGIAFYFKKHGEQMKVRWDYAFFQSMIETNFLTYKTGSGRWGDVKLKQYNFAGIGTTGGGVPGNGFKDVSTGVQAQLGHLIAYSGEYQKNPVAPRTKLKQNEIIRLSRKLRRPVRFDDLAGRWAVDRGYANSIEWVAKRFRQKYCTGRMLQIAQEQARKSKRRNKPQRQIAAASSANGRDLVSAWKTTSQGSAPKNNSQAMAAYRKRQDARERVVGNGVTKRRVTSTVTRSSAITHTSTAAPNSPLARQRKSIEVALEVHGERKTIELATKEYGREKALQLVRDVKRRAQSAIAAKALAQKAIQNGRDRGNDARSALGAPNIGAVNSGLLAGARSTPKCAVMTASYGGTKAVLIKTATQSNVTYTALGVLDGLERSLTDSYTKSHARGGIPIGEFASRDDALRRAFRLCPTG